MKDLKNFLKLYAVTDRSWLYGNSLESQVELCLKGGVTFLQLREKKLPEGDFLREAQNLKSLCEKYGVPFVVNDNVKIAFESNADGVHVGQNDMSCKEVRKILGSEKIIGVSVQNVEQALKAQNDGADYLGVGAIFFTNTKKTDIVEISELKKIVNAVRIPVVAIGGINEKTALKLKDTGIAGICAVSAIFAQKNIEEATRKLKSAWEIK